VKALLSILVPWLGGLVLHPVAAPAVRVPLPEAHAATVRLLGPVAGGGWVLADERGDRRVVLVLRGHRLRTIRSVADPQDGTSFLLSSDGRRVVELDAPTTVRTDVWTFDLAGRDVQHLRRPGWLELLAYDGTTVHLAGSGKTMSWRAGSAPVVADVGGVAADPAHDVLFGWDPGPSTYGPTSLAEPDVEGWSLPSTDFLPASVSPDGRLVAGFARIRHLQIRSMADGSLLSDWKRHLTYERPLVWEDSDHLVWVLRTHRGWALLRCTVGADCTRITKLSGDPLSLPNQEVLPW
jgi:hypothetical protein